MKTPFCSSCLNDTLYSLSLKNDHSPHEVSRLYSYCLDCMPLNNKAEYYFFDYQTQRWSEFNYDHMLSIIQEYKSRLYGKSFFNRNG
jgi:hypothetical protein